MENARSDEAHVTVRVNRSARRSVIVRAARRRGRQAMINSAGGATKNARRLREEAPGAVAVVKGFEPLEGLHPHTLSRRAP